MVFVSSASKAKHRAWHLLLEGLGLQIWLFILKKIFSEPCGASFMF